MRRWLFLIALGAAGALFVRHFLFEGIYLASDSMAPTLPQGRHVFSEKFAYAFGDPRRGDIIVFDSPVQKDRGLVKRVIAVGGDTIEIRRKRVLVNGQELVEPYVQYVRPDEILVGDNLPPTVVPRGHVFVMGDNRDVSGDSRDWKAPSGEPAPFLPLDAVRGRVARG